MSGYGAWVALGFAVAAAWGAIVVINKRTLQYIDPIALNAILRVPTTIVLFAVVATLSLTGAWNLGFEMTWAATAYIALYAIVVWLVAFNTYYLALRLGRIGIVLPITGTDPLFTALFSALLLGSDLGIWLVVGLLAATAGVVWLSRSTDTAAPANSEEPAASAVELQARVTSDPSDRHHAILVVILSALTAAGWGLGPVLVEIAERSLGGPTSTMIVLIHIFGMLILTPLAIGRRRLLVRPVGRPERRVLIILILATSVLEAFFATSFYLLIDAIGSVLTVLIVATAPIFGIVGSVFFLRERYSWKLAIGAATTLAGVGIATLGSG